MFAQDIHLEIGSLLFEGVDQIDLTGPFEVLSRVPNSTYRIYGKTAASVRDVKGLRLAPDAAIADAPPLDVLHVPGGYGQEALMEDAEILAWIRQQAAGACRTVRLLSTNASCWTAAGFLPPASRPALMVPCALQPSCVETMQREQSNSTWRMRQSRLSIAVPPKRHLLQF